MGGEINNACNMSMSRIFANKVVPYSLERQYTLSKPFYLVFWLSHFVFLVVLPRPTKIFHLNILNGKHFHYRKDYENKYFSNSGGLLILYVTVTFPLWMSSYIIKLITEEDYFVDKHHKSEKKRVKAGVNLKTDT